MKSNLLNELLCIIYFNAIEVIEAFLIIASKRQRGQPRAKAMILNTALAHMA